MQEYLQNVLVKKLQVGSGPNVLPGWLNTCKNPERPGVFFLDITKPSPFENNTFDYVFSEHMIEHMSYPEGLMMLRECHRIMKPGGRIRISCPDINFLIRLANNPTDQDIEYIKWASRHFTPWAPYTDGIFVLNNFVRDFHHIFIYNPKTLERSLGMTGFTDFTWHNIKESGDPHLQNLENDSRMPPGFLQIETMTVEAIKPL